MIADILREKFLNFFKSKKHKILPSDSLVPEDDPTILFTPAGMNQFKKEFLGLGRPLKRVATSQRCLRTDDLDKVGKTPGHHTFFEMLGNFSFGDYFKEEAIAFGWEFLTEILKIKKERLWVSVYTDDSDAYNIWKDRIGLPEVRILRFGDKENFWPSEAKIKGPNGPCGPCSEIFFDQGAEIGCKRPDCNPACSCGRFVEVWNLVFTQFNRKDTGLEPLPRKNIDTGMGLERLAAVMQGVYSNFETDLFKPIVKEVVSSFRLQASGLNKELVYAVADHIRAITFAIYDGVLPSNEARGYVVRRLIRRSLLHLRHLGRKQPFLYRLVPIVAQVMAKPYPQLVGRRENISEVILSEEKAFLSILDSAPDLLAQAFQGHKPNTGQVAFKLYDTYGIPLEVTLERLHQQGMEFNQDEFERLLSLQKERSRATSLMKGEVFGLSQLHLKTKKTQFVGYKYNESPAKVIAIFKNNSEVKLITEGEEAGVILDKTPFYAQAGGQVSDTGEIKKGKNLFEVWDVKEQAGIILHIGRLKSGTIKKNAQVLALIEAQRRLEIMRNHTATHILQAVLRAVLGEHVKQQGSLVAPERLRFDFTHFKDVTPDELNRIEELVNQHIWDNDKVSVQTMLIEQARKLGALAFFEEKYQKNVRVVSIANYSRELCGGTHLSFTGQIGLFKIVAECSVASGIRRIEAVTGRFAYARIREQLGLLTGLCTQLKVPQDKVVESVEKLIRQIKELEKSKQQTKTEELKSKIEEVLKGAQDISGIKIITQVIADAEVKNLRSLVDLIKERLPQSICLLATKEEKRANLVMGLTADLLKRGFDAANLIKEVTQTMGGSGGGRQDFAQGAGDADKIELGFNKLKEIVKEKSLKS